MAGKDRDAPQNERKHPPTEYDAPVNTEARRGAAIYRRAKRDLAGALDDLTARAKQLTGEPSAGSQAGSLITEARRMRAESIDVVTYAVLVERAAGANWTEVAAALGLDETFVREHYEPIEQQWLRNEGIGPVIVPAKQEGQRLRLVSG